jgi:hypothetical protein
LSKELLIIHDYPHGKALCNHNPSPKLCPIVPKFPLLVGQNVKITCYKHYFNLQPKTMFCENFDKNMNIIDDSLINVGVI